MQDPRQGHPPSRELQVPCCFPRPWAEEAGAARVCSRIGGSIWWLHMQWLRMSVLFPSLKFLVHITDTQSRIAAGVPSSFADDHCILLQGDFISPWHVNTAYSHAPKPCTLQVRSPKKPFENVLSKPVGLSFEEKTK